MSNAPLQGIKVVELGVWVAGPAVGGLLSDWGADVIKVEPETGDPQRAVFGALGVADQAGVPPFEIDNRGKRSVVIDLRTEGGIASMMTLLADADIFVTNVRPAGLQRLGLDAEALTAKFPRLIYSIITGYGLDGPDNDRAGYDIGAFWARSGLAHTTVAPDELPPGIRSGQGDHTTALSLTGGIMAALFDRNAQEKEELFPPACCARVSTQLDGMWACTCDSENDKERVLAQRTQRAANELLSLCRWSCILVTRIRSRSTLARPT